MMGNMQAESHFEPKLVEYGYQNSRGEISRAGKPSSLDEDVPPDRNSKGQPGYGIVQWTFPSRKQGLRDMAKAQGKKGGDLGVQLDYLWLELSRGFITKLQATTSVEAATRLVLIEFERPANPDRTMPVRLGFAQSILRQVWAKDGGTNCAAK